MSSDREDVILDLINTLWNEVEKNKDAGPGPVLRSLAERVVSERENAVAYLRKHGWEMAADELEAGAHAA